MPSFSVGNLYESLASHLFNKRSYLVVLLSTLALTGWLQVFLNQEIFATGRFKFPWPLAATYFQLIITYVLLLLIAPIVQAAQVVFENIEQYRANRSPVETFHLTTSLLGKPEETPRIWSWTELFKRYIVLSLALLGKMIFTNCALTFAAAHNFEISEMVGFILLLAYQFSYESTSWSMASMTCSVAAAYNTILSNAKTNIRLPWEAKVTSFLSAGSTAAFLYFLHATFITTFLAHANSGADLSLDFESETRGRNTKPRIKATCEMLHYTLLFAILLLTPLMLITGEAWSCWHNYYFWGDQHFQLLILASGVLFGLSICATSLLVQLVTPLVVSFVPVPRVAVQLWVSQEALGGSLVRVLVSTACSIWVLWYTA